MMMRSVIKGAMDAVDPRFRQSAFLTAESVPRLLVFKLEGVTHVAADCVSNRVFGAGHLSVTRWWVEGGDGACLKTDTTALDELGQDVVPGFLHFQRFGALNTPFPTGEQGVEQEAVSFFARHPSEFSCFIPVEFVRTDSERYLWRARRRRS